MLEKKGFTLIELLITIFLISVGLIGVISFFNASLQSQFDAKNEVIAAGLAQEATELVRNIRDYNVLSGGEWHSLDLFGGTSFCRRIDYRSLERTWLGGIYFHKCLGSLFFSDKVCLNNTTGRYRQCLFLESANTSFKRSISVTESGNLDADGYLEVTCTVTWDNGDKKTEAKDRLYSNQF